MQQPIKNIIFDLGGVIMNLDFGLTEKAFTQLGITDFSKYLTQFHITPFFKEYEIGNIGHAEFIKGVQGLAPVVMTEVQIVDAWNAMLLDFPEERIELLKKLKRKYRLFLLSNTNALHHDEFQKRFKEITGSYIESIFEKTYYSHTAHMRKPLAAIYQLVIDENGLNAAETLFIDDTASNFEGATQTGLQTLHLKPPMTIMDIPFDTLGS
jgi:putative hydrolase of the HAD superfamily